MPWAGIRRLEKIVFEMHLGEGAAVTRLAMSPSGKLIALGRDDGQVEMWTLNDGGQQRLETQPSPHRDGISWIDFDSNGEHMVSTSR